MYSPLLSLVAIAQLLLTAGAQDPHKQVYMPYLDAQCKTPANTTDPNNDWRVPGVPLSSYWEPVFSNISTPASGSASNIWWKVVDQDPGCGVALMTAYSQYTWGRLPFDVASGNVIMFANTPGCYYSEISAGAQLSGSFCCGTGDCSLLTGGNKGLTKRDSDYTSPPAPSLEPDFGDVPIVQAGNLEGNPFGRRGLGTRDSTLDLNTCKITTTGDGYPSAGKQTLVANTQSCTGGSCSFAISHGLTVSTSLGSSSDTTITNTLGASVDIKTGIDFIAEAEVTVGASFSFATSIAKSTSTTITNATTVTVTNNLGQAPGTQAFVTFTPTYNCWFVEVDCGTPRKGDFNFCQPALSPDGGLQGDYTVVYI